MKYALLILLLVGVTGVGGYYYMQQGKTVQTPNVTATPTPDAVPKVTIGSKTITAEYARTSAEQQQGLSNRDSLDPNTGMVFVFDQKKIASFWMKDMRISLDFIWVADTNVVDITENVPPPSDPQNPEIISPKEPVNYVIEVNAGFVKEHGIKVGDTVEFLN